VCSRPVEKMDFKYLAEIRKSNAVILCHHAVARQCAFLTLPVETLPTELTDICSPTELDSSTHTMTPSPAVKDSPQQQLRVTNTL